MNLQGQLIQERYAIGALLGEGGDALVYRARDRELQRAVAVKVLRPELRADPTFVARFEREARSVARLNHPHIVPVYDYGEAHGTYFLVMEHVTGGDLRARLQQDAPLPLSLAVRWAVEVADALGAAHAQGIVHRDVKPANILLTEDGHAKVTDFGIAKMLDVPALTATAALIGTPHYLAPEQASGAAITPAADVYLVGLLLYEMLSGRRPFEGETFVQLALQHLHNAPPSLVALNPAVPPSLAGLVGRALAKDPSARVADGSTLAATLRAEAQVLGLADLVGDQAVRAVAAHRASARPGYAGSPPFAEAAAGGTEPPLPAGPAWAAGGVTRGALDAARPRHAVVVRPRLMARIHEGLRAVVARPARPHAPAAGPLGEAGYPERSDLGQGRGASFRARAARQPHARDTYTTTALLTVVLALVAAGFVGTRGLRAAVDDASADAARVAPSDGIESHPLAGAPGSADVPATVATKPMVALEPVAVAEPERAPPAPPSQEAVATSADPPTVAADAPPAREPAVVAPERPVLAAVPAARPQGERAESAPTRPIPDEAEALAVVAPAPSEARASAGPPQAPAVAPRPQTPPVPPQVWIPAPLPPGGPPPPFAAPWAPGLPGPVPPVLLFPAPAPMMASPAGPGPGVAAPASAQPARYPAAPTNAHGGQRKR